MYEIVALCLNMQSYTWKQSALGAKVGVIQKIKSPTACTSHLFPTRFYDWWIILDRDRGLNVFRDWFSQVVLEVKSHYLFGTAGQIRIIKMNKERARSFCFIRFTPGGPQYPYEGHLILTNMVGHL
jgi:hypothetical protein